MERARTRARRSWKLALPVAIVAAVITATSAGTTQAGPNSKGPKFTEAAAFDVSKPLRELVRNQKPSRKGLPPATGNDTDSELSIEPSVSSARIAPGASISAAKAPQVANAQQAATAIPGTIQNFEGLSNQDNFNTFGFRVNPPDPVGDVGPNHYVEMINLVYGVYSKTGTLLLGPVDTGTLWAGFPITDCTDPSGDPIVVYDQVADRWLLSQFTTAGPTYYECIAISQTGDPTGSYYRYAFSTGPNFPDYPKLGVWRDSYILTTREFGPTVEYGIGVYGLERNKMIEGDPNARAVGFFLDGNDPDILPLVGDGLLPPDLDGKQKPKDDVSAPLVGTQDDDFPYGATFDALNIWDFDVKWRSTPIASLVLNTQLPVAEFDEFPCVGGFLSRDCLPQPGITNTAQYLDTLSSRQRPTYRLAYRNFKSYEAMVTNQSIEASLGVAGVRWYEIRRTNGVYSLYQQGTYSPDSVHRWMGSIAQDKKGNAAVGYSVVDGTSVFPGIRYAGRLAGDPLGQMSLGEGTIINGSGVQTTVNSRWGDYTSMNIDPVDDCTFWYVNEYYTAVGQASSAAGWQTRIASFKLPGCS